jgi:uncharacterized phiE125 gp8 family phage protein
MDCLGWKVATEATSEPVSVADAKLHLRLDETGYDETLLPALIKGARQYVERVTSRHLAQQVVEARYPYLDSPMRLPTTPARSIVSIVYQVSGVTTTLDSVAVALLYEIQDQSVFPSLVQVYGSSLPTCDDDSVLVRYNSGPTTPDQVGCAIIRAIVADLFERPEASVEQNVSENKTIQRALDAYNTSW